VIRSNNPLLRLFLLVMMSLSALLVITSAAQTQDGDFAAVPLLPGFQFELDKAGEGVQREETAVFPTTEQPFSSRNTILPERGRVSNSLLFTHHCTPTDLIVGQTISCTTTLQNWTDSPLSVELSNFVPPHFEIIPESLSGAIIERRRFVTFNGSLPTGTPARFAIVNSPSPSGYVSLASLGIPPLANVADDALFNFATPPFVYLGQTYDVLGATSNGYVIPGGGSAADLGQPPQNFPDPTPPNNVIAPFWTDLNPSAGGFVYAAAVSGGPSSWVVLEWENVPAFGSNELYTFQVWIATNAIAEDISFVYNRVDGAGAASGLSIGAENATGTDGANFPGLPTPQDELKPLILPGVPAEPHVISYQATAQHQGRWQNCARLQIPELSQRESICVIGWNSR
jgi:hypothetical protein